MSATKHNLITWVKRGFLIGGPILLASVAIYYVVWGGHEAAPVNKVSKSESKSTTDQGSIKEISDPGSDIKQLKAKRDAENKEIKAHAKTESKVDDKVGAENHKANLGKSDLDDENPAEASAPLPKSAIKANFANICLNNEEFSSTTKVEEVNDQDWKKIMADFHAAKRDLVKFVKGLEKELGKEKSSKMAEIVSAVKLRRPPNQDEPDLNYRSLGFLEKDKNSNDVINLGSGFIETHKKDRGRARFELARYLSQSITTCALKEVGVESPWAKVIGCLGVKEDDQCAIGSNARTAWAVSTVLALQVSQPECSIQALTNENTQKCFKNIKRTIAGEVTHE